MAVYKTNICLYIKFHLNQFLKKLEVIILRGRIQTCDPIFDMLL